MNTSMDSSFESAIILDLEQLYHAEDKLETRFARILPIVLDSDCRDMIARYLVICDNNRVRVNRVLSYLNCEPKSTNGNVINELIDETFRRIRFAQERRAQTLLLIACFQRINEYKICIVKSCLMYAEHLGLEIPCNLLALTLADENEIRAQLSELCVNSFCNCPVKVPGAGEAVSS